MENPTYLAYSMITVKVGYRQRLTLEKVTITSWCMAMIGRHVAVISTVNNNDLRVRCNDDNFMKDFQHWYQTLVKDSNPKIKVDGKSKHTKAIILDGARKDKIFGEYDWDNIIIDYMYNLGYTLCGAGNATKVSNTEHGRQQLKYIFISSEEKAAPPAPK